MGGIKQNGKELTVDALPVIAIHEKGHLQLLFIQKVQQFFGKLSRAIIKGDGVRVGLFTGIENLSRLVQGLRWR